jgi:hypothetical protein
VPDLLGRDSIFFEDEESQAQIHSLRRSDISCISLAWSGRIAALHFPSLELLESNQSRHQLESDFSSTIWDLIASLMADQTSTKRVQFAKGMHQILRLLEVDLRGILQV